MPAPDDTAAHTRARMFLLGWFGAVFDEDETKDMAALLTAFAEHEIEQRAIARGETNEAREVHWLPVHRSDK